MKLMSDILFKAETQYEEEHAAHLEQKEAERRNGQTSMFDLFGPNTETSTHDVLTTKITQIKQSILEQSQKSRTRWEFDNLRCTLIENGWFAQFSEKEFRAACILIGKGFVHLRLWLLHCIGKQNRQSGQISFRRV